MKLDGTEVIKPTPFDAHEQIVRKPHTHVGNEGGYALVDPPAEPAEYPKAIAHDLETGEPIIAKDADHEEELQDSLEAAKPEPVAATPSKASKAAAAAAKAAKG
jgi:hypothetical protein